MSAEENKAIIRRLSDETWNKANLNVINELMVPEVVNHVAGNPEMRGPESFKQFVATYKAAFPDQQWTTDDLIAEDDLVVERWTVSGTQTGPLMNIPATGKRVTVSGISISRIANGKIVEGWSNFDALGMLQQLGVIPAPGQ
jgi:steroid delta-isomerase-like uncharacterized protein